MSRILIPVLAAAALGLGACATGAGGPGPAPLNPGARFALQVEPGVDRIALAVHDEGLSDNQRRALVALAARAGADGADHIRVEAPAGGDPAANRAAWEAKSTLEAGGFRVVLAAYSAPDPRAPVLAGFDTVRAVVPDCSTNWHNLSATAQNQTAANFGCAVHANLAAQIENPRDIVSPRAMTPADAGRRAVVFDRYRRGQQTAAPQEALISGNRVAEAVQ